MCFLIGGIPISEHDPYFTTTFNGSIPYPLKIVWLLRSCHTGHALSRSLYLYRRYLNCFVCACVWLFNLHARDISKVHQSKSQEIFSRSGKGIHRVFDNYLSFAHLVWDDLKFLISTGHGQYWTSEFYDFILSSVVFFDQWGQEPKCHILILFTYSPSVYIRRV